MDLSHEDIYGEGLTGETRECAEKFAQCVVDGPWEEVGGQLKERSDLKKMMHFEIAPHNKKAARTTAGFLKDILKPVLGAVPVDISLEDGRSVQLGPYGMAIYTLTRTNLSDVVALFKRALSVTRSHKIVFMTDKQALQQIAEERRKPRKRSKNPRIARLEEELYESELHVRAGPTCAGMCAGKLFEKLLGLVHGEDVEFNDVR